MGGAATSASREKKSIGIKGKKNKDSSSYERNNATKASHKQKPETRKLTVIVMQLIPQQALGAVLGRRCC